MAQRRARTEDQSRTARSGAGQQPPTAGGRTGARSRHARDSAVRRPPEIVLLEALARGPLGTGVALARLSVGAYLRAAGWALGSVAAAGRRVAVAAREGESGAEFVATARDEAIGNLRRALGVAKLEERLGGVTASRTEEEELDDARHTLRDRGAELLGRSAVIEAEDGLHPAFGFILDQLAPDEARILRLLATEGRQPVLDFHEVAQLGRDVTFLARVSLLGEQAGCMHREHVPAYLDNLVRLGLVRVTRHAVDDDDVYEVLAAQPLAEKAKEAGLPGIKVRESKRALDLTDLGREFTDACLPTDTAPR